MFSKFKRPAPLFLQVIMPFLVLACVGFIFYNSSKTGEISGALSQKVVDVIAGQAQVSLGEGAETLVRKLGHLAEYGLLGFLAVITLRVYTVRLIAFSAWPMVFGLLVAICDECYQLTVPGRSGLVTDVVIDFAGVLCGMGAAWLLCVVFAPAKPKDEFA